MTKINLEDGYWGLSELIHLRSYDQDTELFHNKSSIGFCLEMMPIVGIDESMEHEFSNMFKEILPKNSNVQFLMFSDNTIVESMLDSWFDQRQVNNHELLRLSEKRREHFLSLSNPWNNTSTAVRSYRMIISFSFSYKYFQHKEAEIIRIKNNINNLFNTLEIAHKFFNAQEMLNLYSLIFNPDLLYENDNLKTWNKYDKLNAQIVLPSTYLKVEKEKCIFSGDIAMQSYSVTDFPPEWQASAMVQALGGQDRNNIDCPFFIHYGIKIGEDWSYEKSFFSDMIRLEKLVVGLGRWFPRLQDKLDEMMHAKHALDSGHSFVRTHFQIVIYAKKERLEHYGSRVKSLFSALRWKVTPDTLMHLSGLLCMTPMAWGEKIGRHAYPVYRTTVTEELINLLPVHGDWRGINKTSGMLLVSRRGQLSFFSPFWNKSENYNILFVGKSGSGKSVAIQEYVSSLLAEGGKVFIIDSGRSYEKLCHLLGGEFIELSADSDICINPFSNIPSFSEVQHDKEKINAVNDLLAMIKPIIKRMASPSGSTTDFDNSLLEEAIVEAWRTYEADNDIDKIILKLKEKKTEDADKLAQMLYSYSSHGTNGKFFNGKANINLESNLIVVELDKLANNKDLRDVLLQMIMMQISKKMYLGDRSIKFAVCIDEAWKLMDNNSFTAKFMEEFARTTRKYNGSLASGTQSVDDLYASPAGIAIFNNSSWLCMLKQNSEAVESLARSGRITLDHNMRACLNSLRVTESYSEMMIKGPHGHTVHRLILDKFSMLLYSTKGEEYSAVQHLKKKYTIAEAIDIFNDNKESIYKQMKQSNKNIVGAIEELCL